jgi:hypothetical protein
VIRDYIGTSLWQTSGTSCAAALIPHGFCHQMPHCETPDHYGYLKTLPGPTAMPEGNALTESDFWPNNLVGFSRHLANHSRQPLWGAIMDLFLAEKVAVLESETTHKTCRSCGERLKLIRTMVNSRTGSILHMFECRCGERTWDD